MDRTDRLTPIFERFPPKVRVEFADRLNGELHIGLNEPVGHIHWLRSGTVLVQGPDAAPIVVDQPSVIFVPGPCKHRLTSDAGCELICATFDFGQRYRNPLTTLKPAIMVIPIASMAQISALHALIMTEAFSEQCGKSMAASQLLQYFLLVLFRHLIQTNNIPVGLLTALADDRLLKSVTAIHRDPARAWTLEHLASVANMSRATFARRFHQVMGVTTLDYLTNWRMTVAKSLIDQGIAIKLVATQVGYASPSALTRVFTKHAGLSPKQWAARTSS